VRSRRSWSAATGDGGPRGTCAGGGTPPNDTRARRSDAPRVGVSRPSGEVSTAPSRRVLADQITSVETPTQVPGRAAGPPRAGSPRAADQGGRPPMDAKLRLECQHRKRFWDTGLPPTPRHVRMADPKPGSHPVRPARQGAGPDYSPRGAGTVELVPPPWPCPPAVTATLRSRPPSPLHRAVTCSARSGSLRVGL